jgi:hypothetical protein
MRTFELDKTQAKSSLISLALCNGLFSLVTIWSGVASGTFFTRATLATLGLRLVLVSLPVGYLHALNVANSHHSYGGGRLRSGSFSNRSECGSPGYLTRSATDVSKPSTEDNKKER